MSAADLEHSSIAHIGHRLDRFDCGPLFERITAGRCLGNQILARDGARDAPPPCLECPVGPRVAARLGVTFVGPERDDDGGEGGAP